MTTARGAREGSAAPGAEPSLPPILCYHKVERRVELGVTRISPRRFARQVERLARQGWRTLTLAQVLACARGERRVGTRELAFFFDDAYRGLREHAFPVLAAQGFGAICSVITDYAGKLNRWDVAYGGRRFAHLAWRDMRRWQTRGVEFVSHTATHRRLTWLDEPDAASELERSARALASALDMRVTALSYPYGAASERVYVLARAAGYDAGFRIATRWAGDPMAITTFPVYLWAPPVPGVGMLRRLEWAGAVGANRCSVGTTLLQRLAVRRSTARPPEAATDAA